MQIDDENSMMMMKIVTVMVSGNGSTKIWSPTEIFFFLPEIFYFH